jgi:hypothetical protein
MIDKLLKRAIDYIENVPDDRDSVGHIDRYALLAALKERLADPMRDVQRLGQEIEQEPVGMVKDLFTSTAWERLDLRGSTKVYLDIPPQRTEQDHTYGYASRLAVAIWQKHYMKDAPKWKPLDTTEGVLTQIDNMTCGLVKEKPAQPEQEPEIFCMHWEDRWGCNHYVDPKEPHPVDAKPLYTTPPQRTEEKNT